LELELKLGLRLGLGLTEMNFRSNVFSSKCGRFAYQYHYYALFSFKNLQPYSKSKLELNSKKVELE